ncbi:hypothetical protein V0R37_18605 [Pollutimonas sp. H1-120]|uniref:hypothetical protein n=1 Tax=Pollutimonas sp. H1-120 TaxID=3148824 RepID=UPI003B52F0E0
MIWKFYGAMLHWLIRPALDHHDRKMEGPRQSEIKDVVQTDAIVGGPVFHGIKEAIVIMRQKNQLPFRLP